MSSTPQTIDLCGVVTPSSLLDGYVLMGLPKGAGRQSEQKSVGHAQGIRVAKLAACRVFGLPRAETAVLLETSVLMITKWGTKYRDLLVEFETFLRSIMPKAVEPSAVPIADREAYLAAVEQRLTMFLPILDKAATGRDMHTALNALKEIHKVLGFTTQTMKVEHAGTVTQRKVIDVSPALAQIANRTLRRHELPAAFEEAELVGRS